MSRVAVRLSRRESVWRYAHDMTDELRLSENQKSGFAPAGAVKKTRTPTYKAYDPEKPYYSVTLYDLETLTSYKYLRYQNGGGGRLSLVDILGAAETPYSLRATLALREMAAREMTAREAFDEMRRIFQHLGSGKTLFNQA